MKVFTAERSSGDVWCVHAQPGYDRVDFIKDVLALVKDEDGDVAPHELHLFEWPDETTAGVWLLGVEPLPKESWTTMGHANRFAEIRYVYPGEYECRETVLDPRL